MICWQGPLPKARLAGWAAEAAMDCPKAPTSIGSPRGVPVPCTLTMLTSWGSTAAAARALRTRADCAGPLGAVRPEERPA